MQTAELVRSEGQRAMGKGEGRATTNRRSTQIIEPTDDEKAAAKAAWTFGRSFSKDSTALGVLAFALFFFIVFSLSNFPTF